MQPPLPPDAPAIALALSVCDDPKIGLAKNTLTGTLGVLTLTYLNVLGSASACAWASVLGSTISSELSRVLPNVTRVRWSAVVITAAKVLLLKLYLLRFIVLTA